MKLLSILLVALVTGAWVIKEAKQDEDISFYVNDGGVVTKALEIDGATGSVSLGATSIFNLSRAALIDGTSNEVQLTTQGNLGQTNDVFVVENSSATNILEVKGEGATGGSRVELRGIGTNTVAAAGFVGEVLTQSRSRTNLFGMATNVSSNITASPLSLTPGDWDMQSCISFINSAGANTSYFLNSISLTSGASADSNTIASYNASGEISVVQSREVEVSGNTDHTICTPVVPVQISATTNYYLVGFTVFSAGSVNAYGRIWARRVR